MNDEDVLFAFGNHIRRIRLEKNLSQEDLAYLSGLDRTYISGIERGKRNLGLINIIKIAASLNEPPEKLLVFDKGGKSE